MIERLTDEQVAALATEGRIDVDFRDGDVSLGGSPPVYDLSPDDTLRALALEVQQARARRCDACRYWHAMDEGARGYCDVLTRPTKPGWHCADFTGLRACAHEHVIVLTTDPPQFKCTQCGLVAPSRRELFSTS